MVVACLPVVISVAWAIANHRWVAGDRSIMGVLTHDVFTTNTPLLSTPSTMRDYADSANAAAVHHLGPIQFWILAIPDWLLGGRPAGLLLGGMIVNCTAITVFAVFLRRRMGLLVAAAGTLLCTGLAFGLGPSLLREIWTPFLGLWPILCLIVLVWSLIDGDEKALPWAVLVATFLAQIELLYVAPTAVLAFGGAIGFVLHRSVHRRAARRVVASGEPSPEALPSLRRPIRASVLIAVLFWWPPLVQQVTGKPGNLTALVEALGTQKARISPSYAFHNLISLVSFRPTWTRRVGSPFEVGQDPSVLQLAGAAAFVLLYGVAVVVAWRSRRRNPSRLSLLATGGIVLAAAVANLRILPVNAAFGLQYRRWIWPFSAFLWFALLVALGGWVADQGWSAALRQRWRAMAAAICVGLAAIVVVPASAGQLFPPTDDVGDNLVVQSLWGPLYDRIPKQSTYVRTVGVRSLIGQGPEIIRRLVVRGVTVRVLTSEDIDYGAHRTLSRAHPANQTLELLSSETSLAPEQSPVAVLAVGRRDGRDADGFVRLAGPLLPRLWRSPPIVLKPASFRRVISAYAEGGQSVEDASDVLANPSRALFDRSILREIAAGGAITTPITPQQASALDRGLNDVQTIAYLMPAPDPAHPNRSRRTS